MNGGSRGLLWLELPAAREFTDEDRAFLAACAGQCSQALERAQLHERTAVAASRSAFHARASQALDEVQGFSERAQRLLELVVEHLGGLAWIELREDDERLVAVAGADREGTPRDELLSRPRAARLSSHAARAVEDALAAGEPRVILEPQRRGGAPAAAHSYVALPLRARGHALGVLILARFAPERRFRTGDLAFLAELADRAGLALENARLYEQRATSPGCSSRACSPGRRRRIRASRSSRATVGDRDAGGGRRLVRHVRHRRADRIGIVVGDVVGRGIVAASAMGQLRSAIRALAAAELGPRRGDRPARRVRRADRDCALGDGRLRGCRPGERAGSLRVGRTPAARARRAGTGVAVALDGALAATRRRGQRRTLGCRDRAAAGRQAPALHGWARRAPRKSRSTSASAGSWRSSTHAGTRR